MMSKMSCDTSAVTLKNLPYVFLLVAFLERLLLNRTLSKSVSSYSDIQRIDKERNRLTTSVPVLALFIEMYYSTPLQVGLIIILRENPAKIAVKLAPPMRL